LIEVRTIVLHDIARAKPKSQSLTAPPLPAVLIFDSASVLARTETSEAEIAFEA
jgi:hypothetical protein